jgi:SNF2 family DNA or RNA helicase
MPLRPYQRQAVRFLWDRPKSALLLDMGLGKTAICLAALTGDHLPALVVAPKRVAESVWEDERDLWRPDLDVAVAAARDFSKTAAAPAEQRMAALKSGADVVVIGRDNMKEILAMRNRPFRTLIIDELSGFKQKPSVRWRVADQLIHKRGTRIENVWGLTGTPAPNGLMDLWAPMYLLDEGKRLHTTLGEYRARYFQPGKRLRNGKVAEWTIVNGMDEVIHTKISDIAMSMSTEGRVDLPTLVHNEVNVTLDGVALKAYNELEEELVTNLTALGGEVHSAQDAAQLTNRLEQVCAGFVYSDLRTEGEGTTSILHKEKAEAVLEIVEGTGTPTMVFYKYTEEIPLITAALKRAGIQAHRLKNTETIRAWNRGDVRVLIAHPASAGHGLNLQHGGHTQIWASLTWSLEEWEQGIKRLWRSGQQHPVMIHRLMARKPSGAKTIDHVKEARIIRKKSVQDALLEYLEAPR